MPSRPRHHLFLGPSPPVVIGHATIMKLLSDGIDLGSPSVPDRPQQRNMLQNVALRADKSSLTPQIIGSLLAHYTRCIEPVYPVLLDFPQDIASNMKQFSDADRCRVLLACSIAAAHRSYHVTAWKALAKTTREWAGELALSLIDRHDDQTMVVLLMLSVYELVDPDSGLFWELLTCAGRMYVELGWQLMDCATGAQVVCASPSGSADTEVLSSETKRRLLSVLVNIERYAVP